MVQGELFEPSRHRLARARAKVERRGARRHRVQRDFLADYLVMPGLEPTAPIRQKMHLVKQQHRRTRRGIVQRAPPDAVRPARQLRLRRIRTGVNGPASPFSGNLVEQRRLAHLPRTRQQLNLSRSTFPQPAQQQAANRAIGVAFKRLRDTRSMTRTPWNVKAASPKMAAHLALLLTSITIPKTLLILVPFGAQK
jgi:hypothetical protein